MENFNIAMLSNLIHNVEHHIEMETQLSEKEQHYLKTLRRRLQLLVLPDAKGQSLTLTGVYHRVGLAGRIALLPVDHPCTRDMTSRARGEAIDADHLLMFRLSEFEGKNVRVQVTELTPNEEPTK